MTLSGVADDRWISARLSAVRRLVSSRADDKSLDLPVNASMPIGDFSSDRLEQRPLEMSLVASMGERERESMTRRPAAVCR